jgi:hypothetical protein
MLTSKQFARILFLSIITFALAACTDGKQLSIERPPPPMNEYGFEGYVIELSESEVSTLDDFSENITLITKASSFTTDEEVGQVKEAIEQVSGSPELTKVLIDSLDEFQLAQQNLDVEWLDTVKSKQAVISDAIAASKAKKAPMKATLDKYYEMISPEQERYDVILAQIEENKTKMSGIVAEITEFVNKTIVDEKMVTEKVTNDRIDKALATAILSPKGSQGHRVAITNSDIFCPRNPAKKATKPKLTNTRHGQVWCRDSGWIELDGIDYFANVNVLGVNTLRTDKFSKPYSEHWKYLVESVKRYQAA